MIRMDALLHAVLYQNSTQDHISKRHILLLVVGVQEFIVVIQVVDDLRTMVHGIQEADILPAKVIPWQPPHDAVREPLLILDPENNGIVDKERHGGLLVQNDHDAPTL